MTNANPEPFDPVMRTALDRFSVPAASSDFLERVADASSAALGNLPPHRPRYLPARRGFWARRASIGVIAFGLASATAAAAAAAAAAGIFDTIRLQIPAITAMLLPAPMPSAPAAKPVRRVAAISDDVSRTPGGAPLSPAVPPAPLPPAGAAMMSARERFAQLPPAAQAMARERLVERAVTRVDTRLESRGIDVPRPVIRLRIEQRLATRRADLAGADLGRAGLGRADLSGVRMETLRERSPAGINRVPNFDRPTLAPDVLPADAMPPRSAPVAGPAAAIVADQVASSSGGAAAAPLMTNGQRAPLRQQFREWRARRQALRQLRNQ